MTTAPYSKQAGMFLLVGVFVTCGLLFLMTTAVSGLAGWGDGSGQSSDASSPTGLVLPYSAYFLCGVVAACSAKRGARIAAAIVAHSAPFASQAFASSKDGPIFIGIDLVTFVMFGFAWFQMLRKDDHAA